MDAIIEVTTGIAGVAIGIGAGRLFLEGILAAAFGRRL
jgi:hypothetical protein